MNQEETQPLPLNDETQPITSASTSVNDQNESDDSGGAENGDNESPSEANGSKKGRSISWPWLITISLAALLLIAATSASGGYLSGINERTDYEITQVAQQVSEQYQLGLEDFEAKRYELARQRFEYVIRLDPNYPGVTEQLALVLLEINTTATPTQVPTPTLTPTPDTRGVDELFSQSQILLADGEWTEAIETLLKLRKDEPDYQTIKVDSMLYVALRNRGVDRILREGDLEGGTYDLALAEKFGPLDIEASNMRTWADLYKTGASFWGLDWGQAAFYFGQVVVVTPNLRDNTNMTAAERFRIASIKYGDTLAANKDWCLAQEQYEAAFSLGEDPSVQPTASWVTQKCRKSENGDKEEQEAPPPEAAPTEGAAPTESPPPEPAPTESPPPEPPPTEPPPSEPPPSEPAPTDIPPTEPPATTEPPPEANPSPTP
jgi:tetratricopeptide (TPR) repeat protein